MLHFSDELLRELAPVLVKLATELTPVGREHIKDKNFVFPEEKKYPIHDKQHAESALGFSKMHGSPEVQARVRAAVIKKYPGLELEKKSAAPKKEKRRPWNVANIRSGKRPMSVDTMLKKEKDGTLNVKLGQSLLKLAQFFGPSIPFTDSSDRGAAPTGRRRMDSIPSREEVESQTPKREDGRSFTTTDVAPGTSLFDIATTNSPQERTT